MEGIFKKFVLSVNTFRDINPSIFEKGSSVMYFLLGSLVVFFTMLPVVIYQLIEVVSGT